MTSYTLYRGQIWQIIHDLPKILLASDNLLADAHICQPNVEKE